MAGEVTDLQRELIHALLDSGITKNAIIKTIDAFLAKPPQKNQIPEEKPSNLEPAVARGEYMTDSCDSSDAESTKDEYNEVITPVSQVSQNPLLNPDSVGDHLLRMDPWQAARVIKMYMQQHNIPQREVVETTGLNQSHLSQHLNKGTPMKSQKRVVLYNWFEKKQKEIALQYSNPGKRLFPDDDDESPSKKSRRNRFKWGPASTNLLYNAYEQQRNPSKEERESLVIQCNKAECDQRGVPYSNVGGLGPNLVTESRVYNWFANRRKEETFRMKLAIEAAGYQDTPNQTLTSPSSSQLPPIAPKMTIATSSQTPTAQLRQSMTSPVHTSYPALTSSAYQPTTNQVMTAANAPVCSGQILPGVGTLMQSTNTDNNIMSQPRPMPVMTAQNADQAMMLSNNIAGNSTQYSVSSPLALSITSVRSPQQMIPPNASQALQAMASTVRQIQPTQMTNISTSTGLLPPLMTPVSVPSITVSHIARSPIATIEHLATHEQRSRDNERQVIINPALVAQDVRKQILLQETNNNCLLQTEDEGSQSINGEHVTHQEIQAISPVVKDRIEKEAIQGKSAEESFDGISLNVKIEESGANVEEVASIAETVTVETTTSGENTPVNDSKQENTGISHQEFTNPTKAVIVQVNGNHDDAICS